MEWEWVPLGDVLLAHDEQIAAFGGGIGVRDMNAVEAGVARAQRLADYGDPVPDAADLAAACIFGIPKGHGFVDGNKRTAWTVANVFLEENGFEIRAGQFETILTVEAVAASDMSIEELADWLRDRIYAVL
jgi:death on curing protein